MLAAWRWPIALAMQRGFGIVDMPAHSFHSSASVSKKSTSKYTKLMLLNARHKRNNDRAAKASSQSKPRTKKAESGKATQSKSLKKTEDVNTAVEQKVPEPTPPSKVVSFPRPSVRRTSRPTSFLRGDDANKARTVRLEEYHDGTGDGGERVGRLAASDISIESTCRQLIQLCVR